MNDDELRDPEAHEERGVNVRKIVIVVGVFLAVMVVLHVSMALLLGFFVGVNDEVVPEVAPVTPQVFAGPQLQEEPADEWETLRQQQEAVLHRYEWIDEGAGVARIPIERAMAIIAAQGVPTPAAAKSEGE